MNERLAENRIVFEGVYKMKGKWAVFAVFGILGVLAVNIASGVVNTAQIDRVRNKGVLDNGDLRTIDKFVAEAVQQLVKTTDFTFVSKARTVILSRLSSNKDSAAAQYSQQFSDSVYKYLSEAFNQTQMLTPEDRRFKVILNLLILLDSLEDVQLLDLAIEQLDDENAIIRYWAVHAAANPNIIKQLKRSNSTEHQMLVGTIAEKLKVMVEAAGPEILALAAEFAAEVDIPQAEELLLQIADLRIKRYEDWTVKNELLDATVLKSLSRKLSSVDSNNSAVARRFGQLYSYAMQKYISDISGGSFLSASQKQQLASVLVEVEKSCLGKLLGVSQTIKKAVDLKDYVALLEEHNRLLGDETRTGELAEKLKFDYGKTATGRKRIEPLVLPERPRSGAGK